MSSSGGGVSIDTLICSCGGSKLQGLEALYEVISQVLCASIWVVTPLCGVASLGKDDLVPECKSFLDMIKFETAGEPI